MDENKKGNNLVPEPEEKIEQLPDAAGDSAQESIPSNVLAETARDNDMDSEKTSTEAVNEDAENVSESTNDEDKTEPELQSIVVQPVEGVEPVKRQKKSHKKFWTIFLSVILAIVVVLGGLFLILDPLTAVKVGGNRISLVEYEYYYKTMIAQTANSYTSTYGLDTSKELGEQTCPLKKEDGSSFGTWKDYYNELVKEQLQNVYAMYDDAKKNKEVLSADDAKKIDETVTKMKEAATAAGQSLKEYTGATYGTKMSERVLLKLLRVDALTNNHYAEFSPAKDYSEQELNDYYEKNKDQFDVASLRYFGIEIDASATDGAAKAKAKAEAMLKNITDEKSFIAQAKANATDSQKTLLANDNATLISKWSKSMAETNYAPDEFIAWMFDASRKAGDKGVVTDGSMYYVLYMITPAHRNETPTMDMRHILIRPEADSNEASTDAQKKAAKEKAEALYKKWQEGAKTEDSFAALAKENSEDEKSKENGGLCPDVEKGDFVTPIDNWCFDAARKPGDTSIVESTYGYHVVYFVKQGSPAWMGIVKDTMNEENKQTALSKLAEATKYKVNKFGMKFVNFTL